MAAPSSSLKPTPKMLAALGTGTIAAVATYIAHQLGVDIPKETALWIEAGVLLAFTGGFGKRDVSSPAKKPAVKKPAVKR
ncbi:MAG TPA: hypothetical protein VE645_19140 [Pseudonocardiaceae bacterium]|jgi:hypothetical protein|nr:hypothetical protein [Pseudonocardiaceae bacterium]